MRPLLDAWSVSVLQTCLQESSSGELDEEISFSADDSFGKLIIECCYNYVSAVKTNLMLTVSSWSSCGIYIYIYISELKTLLSVLSTSLTLITQLSWKCSDFLSANRKQCFLLFVLIFFAGFYPHYDMCCMQNQVTKTVFFLFFLYRGSADEDNSSLSDH